MSALGSRRYTGSGRTRSRATIRSTVGPGRGVTLEAPPAEPSSAPDRGVDARPSRASRRPQSARACLAAGATRAIVPVIGDRRSCDRLPGVARILPRIADREIEALFGSPARRRAVTGNLGLVSRASKTGVTVEATGRSTSSTRRPSPCSPSRRLLRVALAGAVRTPDRRLDPRSALPLASRGLRPTRDDGDRALRVQMAEGPCERKCGSCERRVKPRLRSATAKATSSPLPPISPSVPRIQCCALGPVSAVVPELLSAGVSASGSIFELDYLRGRRAPHEDARNARALQPNSAATREKSSATTSGHYFRGVHCRRAVAGRMLC